MPRRSRSRPRTPEQVRADRGADELVQRFGRSLAGVRKGLRLKQVQASDRAGLARSTWSWLEVDADGGVTVAALCRAAMAMDREIHLYLGDASAADQPRDAVHLRTQELIAKAAAPGGWRWMPEEPIDRNVASSRAADMLLNRELEWALADVWDWFDDVGAAFRAWDRRLAAVDRLAITRMPVPAADAEDHDPALPRVSGCWIVRATHRNRKLVSEHRHVFRARFPGSGRAWLAALATSAPMPATAAILWASVDGTRLYASRLA